MNTNRQQYFSKDFSAGKDSKVETLYNREVRLRNDLEPLKITNPMVKQFDNNLIAAKIIKVNSLKKLRFDAKYKDK